MKKSDPRGVTYISTFEHTSSVMVSNGFFFFFFHIKLVVVLGTYFFKTLIVFF